MVRIRFGPAFESVTGKITDDWHSQHIRGRPVLQRASPHRQPVNNNLINRQNVMSNANALWNLLIFPRLGIPETFSSQYQKAWTAFATGMPVHRDASTWPDQEEARLAALNDIISKNRFELGPDQLLLLPPSLPILDAPEPVSITRTETRIEIVDNNFPFEPGLRAAGRIGYAIRTANIYDHSFRIHDRWRSNLRLSSSTNELFITLPPAPTDAHISIWFARMWTNRSNEFLYSRQYYQNVPPA